MSQHRARQRMLRLLGVVALDALAGLGGSTRSAQLPVPCLARSCGASGPAGFVTSGSAAATQAGNTLTVQQSSAKTILNWSLFNVSADGRVVFQQPTTASVVLNRIFDANPSTILGTVNANGQIYLINPNGFVFGSTARVNTAGLVAASLGMSDSTFSAGLLSPQLILNRTPALTSDPRVLAANGNPQLDSSGNPVPGSVTVAPGAQITAASGGRILLAAPTAVQNSGTLEAPDGQVVLAAGEKVYLQASNSPELRGLVVEVDQGGKSWNQLTGNLSAPRGNITLVGLAVNQDGRISATTTVSANGSVRLEAGDTATSFPASAADTTSQIASSRGGTLEFGPQGRISILPELTDTSTAVDAQPQSQSTVTLLGQQVFVHGGSIVAPAGQLTVIAAADPGSGIQGLQGQGNAAARVRIDPGTNIDLSGSTAELPMSANLVTLQLRANELADDPTQRNGALRGTTVTVDTRVGTAIANVQSAIAAVPKTIAQRTESGGSLTIGSEGDIVVAQGATIDVSGGKTLYDGGVIQTTQLVGANGKLYDIGTANPLLTYTGVLNPTFTETFNKWGVQDVVSTPGLSHYESGYAQGAGAGSLTFAAPNMVLNGTFIGHALNGPHQRGSTTMVSGGQLIIGVSGGLPSNSMTTDFLSPPIVFSSRAIPTIVADSASLPAVSLDMPIDYLVNGGFTSTAIYDNFRVTLPTGLPLTLIPGSSFSIEAPRIDILSSITDLAGSVALHSVLTLDAQSPGVGRPGVQLAGAVTVDVRGQWTNDSPSSSAPTVAGPTLQNGGTIDLALSTLLNGELVLGDGVALRASGGAWVNSSNKATGGTGGTIVLQAGPAGSAVQVSSGIELDAFGVGTARGGTFSLSAPRLRVSDGAAWTAAQRVDDTLAPEGVFEVYTPLFSEYGFSTVNLSASGLLTSANSPTDALTVAASTDITALTRSLQLSSDYLTRPSGGTVAAFARVVTLPVLSRPSENVSFSVAPQGTSAGIGTVLGTNNVGLLDVQRGASIATDPGASIDLAGVGGVFVDGGLHARGGTITLETLTPTDPLLDPGYLAALSIELGAQAVLDVSGTAKLTPNDLGLRLGSVLAGGSVNLFADRGSVITQPGSLIDISGTNAVLDIQTGVNPGQYASHRVASAGGALTVRSPESIALLGGLRAAAGTGDLGQPNAGSLEVDLTRSRSWFFAPDSVVGTFPTTPRVISLVADNAGSQPAEGLAALGTSQVLSSGIDSLFLEAGDRLAADDSSINIATNIPIALARQVSLDAPAIAVGAGVNASLHAPYVTLGNSLAFSYEPAATSGGGSLRVSAAQIDLTGATVLQGVGTTTLSSGGDLLLLGATRGGTQLTGNLLTAGNLTLSAARIFPATGTAFSITASGAGHSVTIGQTGASPGIPLSVAGSLTINADNIESSGTLIAPYGTIDLEAGNSLTLASGSVTSVNGGNTVLPYGNTQLGGTQWVYGGLVTAVPARQVTLHGPAVTLTSQATVDLRGGGDLYAYEWVPGTGGSHDALAPNVVPGLYAVVPSMLGQSAPYDPVAWAGSPLTAGSSIYLSGSSGLAAGIYPLLPARYGLLAGARLVQVQPGYQNIVPGQGAALPDGTPVVAGYLTFGDTGLRAAQYSGVAVWPSSYARQIAGYQDSYASTFFARLGSTSGAVALPADAGRLSIDVGSTLNVAGEVLSSAAANGRSAEIDVSAAQLEVSSAAVTAAPRVVDLPASVIQNWGAGELVLGGHASQDNSQIAVTADSVTIDAGVRLSADQIVLLADRSIDLQSGSSVTSTSGKNATALSAIPTTTSVSLTGTGADGAALLAVSDQALILVQRPASAGAPLNAGVVQVENGASISTRGALSLDAPGGARLAGSVGLVGASVSLSASSIGLLAQAPASDALQIDGTLLSALQQASNVRLASQGPINVYAPVALGASNSSAIPALASLTLVGSALNNVAGADVVLGARTLALEGVGKLGSQTAASGSGTLSLVAGELDLGPGTLIGTGFGLTTMRSSGAVVGSGTGALIVGGDLSITTGELTAAAASQTLISAPGGTLTVNATPTAAASTLPTYVGGALTLSANRIQDNGSINVFSGLVSLQASQQLSLGSTAAINAGGTMVSVLNRSVGSAGGAVNLSSGGSIDAAAGSVISVAGAGDASAGNLALVAGGAVTLQGRLLGNPGQGAIGGSFALQAGQLGTDLDTLAATLQSGAFADQIAIQVHSGDLNLGAGNLLSSNRVSLATDTGTVRIDGSVSAPSAGQRGQIGLFGGQAVLLDSSAQLHADGSGSNGRGGDIELGTAPGGAVSLAAGSIVSTVGAAQPGTLLIRAPATATGDVALTELNANVSAVGQIVIEPVLQVTASTTLGASDFNAIQTTVGTYMSGAATAIPARLNPAGTLPLVIRPGVELDASGALTLTDALDLSSWRFGGQPIDLAVRSPGSIVVDNAISDGIVAASTALNQPTVTLGAGPSSSIRLIAGANLGSANPLATSAGSPADLTLAPNAMVRTGSGEIDLVAARDVVLSPGASVYTAGIAAGAPVLVPRSNSVFNFPTGGGNLLVSAGRDVIGAPVSQSITAWQLRQGNTSAKPQPVQWGVDLNDFGWNLGSLGGGDLRVAAGRNILNLSAAASDTRIANMDGSFTQSNGGGLVASAGGDIGSGQFYAADGLATLSAGGAFSAVRAIPQGSSTGYVGALIALDDAQVSLQARLDVTIDAVVNPTTLTQLSTPLDRAILSSGYFTYGGDSSLTIQSSAGSISMVNNGSHLSALMGQDAATGFGGNNGEAYPATFIARSLQHDVTFNGAGPVIFPSDNGQFELLAGRDINDISANIVVSDAYASSLPSPASPGPGGQLSPSLLAPFASGRHASDTLPALITAGRDINSLILSVPKQTQISAGRDISNLTYDGQNLRSTDLTLISAGRDFVDTQAATGAVVQLGGPGRLDVVAGRNVDLGFSEGITTVGNLSNANLSTAMGADLTVMAGLGQAPNYGGFLKSIIEPSTAYQQDLLQYVEAQTGQSGLTVSQAQSLFAAFTEDEQRPLIDRIFFEELVASGHAANSVPGAGFTRGYAAIDALFPASRTGASSGADPYQGDLSMTFSRIYTIKGGTVSLFAPGGALDVGLANAPLGVPSRQPSQLGIVAQGAGNVDIYTKGDVLVNASRIFTLGGGNILIWSDEGSIDAGRGSKSSISAPPPLVLFDSLGNVTLNLSGAVAGSGIRTIQIDPSVPPGNVDLIAPQGTVNAGDAGIGAAGNLNIAAQQVIGLDNIQFGGTATGVPAQVSNLGASLAGFSAVASSASSSATSSASEDAQRREGAAPLAQSAISWLDVFVTGLGEENCKPDDIECLKRQRTNIH
jgi:filamentous hemagglutinin